MINSRTLNNAPAEGDVEMLNPPRFRWYYVKPQQNGKKRRRGWHLNRFTFQIAETADFEKPLLSVQTTFNFYNAIPLLPAGKKLHWRVGYSDQLADKEDDRRAVQWGETISFTISPDAKEWDRSAMAKPDYHGHGHPRLLFNKKTLPLMRDLAKNDELSRKILNDIVIEADRARYTEWWKAFPKDDRAPAPHPEKYFFVGRKMARAAFAYWMTGDKKFYPVKDLFVKLARFKKGGWSSPESAGGDKSEDSTHVTEFLALGYDWFYDDLTAEERKICEESLEWRIEHMLNRFWWGGMWRVPQGGKFVVKGGLALGGGGHAWEGGMGTLAAALAIMDKSEVAREFVDLFIHFIAGVVESEKKDETGSAPGYGLSHLKWLLYATSYLHSIFPEFRLEKHPWFTQTGEFYCHVNPVGMKHCPWGRTCAFGSRYTAERIETMRLLAHLTRDGRFLMNWMKSGGGHSYYNRPWVQYATPLFFPVRPKPVYDDKLANCWVFGGMVTAHTYPPSNPRAFNEGAGIAFGASPAHRGGSNYFNDNTFHLYAYGECLNYGGSTGGEEPSGFPTFSHNGILVDGLGQMGAGGKNGFKARITGFKKGEGFVYMCGDATHSYPHEPTAHRSNVRVRLDNKVYGKRAVPHLRKFKRHILFLRNKYFVIADDLETDRDKPARFTWNYHVLDKGPFEFDQATGSMNYRVGRVRVFMKHNADLENLEFMNRKGLEGLHNPMTGEDYRNVKYLRWKLDTNEGQKRIVEHNIWLTNRKPKSEHNFFTVIYPVKPESSYEPVITLISDLEVKVECEGDSDVVSFNPKSDEPFTIKFGSRDPGEPNARPVPIKKKVEETRKVTLLQIKDAIRIPAKDMTAEDGGRVKVSKRSGSANNPFIRDWDFKDHWIEWKVTAPEAGSYECWLRSATNALSPRNLSLNGKVVKGLERFVPPKTGGWDQFCNLRLDVPLDLKKGENVIRMTSLGGHGVNVDELLFRPVTKELQEGTVKLIASSYSGEGGGKVMVSDKSANSRNRFIREWDYKGHWLEWKIPGCKAGKYEVIFRYATNSKQVRKMTLNGEVVDGLEGFKMPLSGGWDDWCEVLLPVPVKLKDGDNILRMENTGGNGLNMDEVIFRKVE